MSVLINIGVDLVAICVLTFGIYFPRYRRADMVISYVGLNIGVTVVSLALSKTTTLGTGFGLGLFGALSIIRLRSSEMAQQEVAYYFAALALGLIGGIEVTPRWLGWVLPATIVVAMFLADHPKLFGGYRHQIITVDRAFTDEFALQGHLETLLSAKVSRLQITKLDLVNDSTIVDVRYRLVTAPNTSAAPRPKSS
jgi:hypothetical protein